MKLHATKWFVLLSIILLGSTLKETARRHGMESFVSMISFGSGLLCGITVLAFNMEIFATRKKRIV